MEFSQSAWVGIAFILFFILVGKKLFSVIFSSLDERSKKIKSELDEAIKLKDEAQNELKLSLKKQKEINNEIDKILLEAKEVSKKIKKDAEIKINQIILRREDQAKEKIYASQMNAIKELRNISTNLAITSAKNYIKDNINQQTTNKLFELTTKELNKKL